MPKLQKEDPASLLGHHRDDGDERLKEIIKMRGYNSETDLKQRGNSEDKEILEKSKELAEMSRDHHNSLKTWLELVNKIVDEVEDIKTRLDNLEKKN